MRLVPILLASANNSTAAPASPTPYTGGFLFVTFKGQQNPLDEQIYFSLSKDGRNWTALNDGNPVVWVKNLKNGDKAVSLFNRGETATDVELLWSEAGLTGDHEVRDLWLRRNLGSFNEKFSSSVPGHGVILLPVK